MPKIEWTELDEQMSREGNAIKRGMKSVGAKKRAGDHTRNNVLLDLDLKNLDVLVSRN